MDGDADAMARHKKRVHTRRRIHYSQVMGEVMINYFQRWTG